jgi:uncharacterized protein with HEPN domain
MDNKVNAWLYDILNAIIEIESFIDANMTGFVEYQNDIKTKRAVERNIEIVGEALNRIYKHDNNIEIENSRKIIDTRNRIIHGYDSVSDDIIWTIATQHLTTLKVEIEKLLAE